MGRANKEFHRLSLDRLVWVDQVVKLRRKGFIDRLSPSEINSYSQQALVDLVKRILIGPASWNAPVEADSVSRPSNGSRSVNRLEISTQLILHPSEVTSAKKNEAMQLNGGEYVLFNNSTLECYRVQDDKRLWAYEREVRRSFMRQFAAEVVYGGHCANIIVCESLGADHCET
ncbi:hypothetical protein B0H16DRAFT_1502178 [Mycena metata]|uniref:Uncharacterized protein n=1 Tax=Mycena metata TaxID=1033252 RepID=A0AAD7K8T1_9AGAR|nr:hypothetical protein B0H16DRAFT_1502178 [Mycena metata]